MRNLRPEKIDSRASTASEADSPQRLRASLKTVSHRQRRSTNNPRLKLSAGKGKPGQHTKHRTVTTRPSNRLIPGWLLSETTAPTPCKTRKLHPTGATCAHPPTNTVRNTLPTSGTSGTFRNHSLKETQKPFANQPPKTMRPTIRNKHLNQTPQNTDKQCVCGGGARHITPLSVSNDR